MGSRVLGRELQAALWQGDHQNDDDSRQYLQGRVSQLWQGKDARIAQLRAEVQ